MNKSRLEAFSDGVLAIIITIMVLELHRPVHDGWADLLRLWPILLSYLISFVYVGIYWNNHHHLFQVVRHINGSVMWANLHLLFWLSLFPFVTGWAGESHFAPVPMTCYAAVALLSGVAYTLLARALIRVDESNQRLAQAMNRDLKGNLSIAAYLVALVAPFFGRVGTLLSGLMLMGAALMWIVPDKRIERVLAQKPDPPEEH